MPTSTVFVAGSRQISRLPAEVRAGLDTMIEKGLHILVGDANGADKADKSFDRDDDESWHYPDSGHSYWNDYGRVFFRNMNANRDSHRAEHWFTDYYEEEP